VVVDGPERRRPDAVKVLVACEFSGIVRDAFIRHGHDAISCDLLSTERPGPHLQTDVRTVLSDEYDLMVAHPPCTYLAVSGNRWRDARPEQEQQALDFVQFLLDAPIKMIALENPIGVISTKIRKPTQIVHPWMFGHAEKKATCLWLKNLPFLDATFPVPALRARVHRAAPSPDRWKERSRTLPGLARAMAAQWGSYG
jgi:site-specific DNA-cytosine methylase